VGIEFDKYRGKYPKALLIRGISPYVLDKYEVYYNGTDIVIPVRDEFGMVRFIKSRKLLDKYYTNSGNKKSILYGLYYLINSSKKFREVYITEGEFDTMACYQAGLPAVSTMGNVLFREQLSLLYKYFSTVNIFFDNDKAGKIGTYNAMNLIVKEKLPIKVNLIKYPDDSCKDPNELLSGNKIDKIEKISAMVSKFL
jgi:DNA primase